MKEAGPKRKRDEDTEDGAKSYATKKVAKSGRRSLRPVRPYSVDDFANYLRDDDTMNWDQVLDSFHFDIRFLDPKEKKPNIIPHGTEPLSFKSDADASLDVDFVIQPAEVWKSMNRYRKFTISQSAFQVMDHVLVSYDSADDDQNHGDEGEWPYGSTWPAKILKVMAGNESHVYLLVNYFFRPEDIEPGMIKASRDSGRQPYHGRNEVIASNWLEVVDAKTVSSKIEIEHWNEHDDDDFPQPGKLFWRQHLNYTTKQLSTLRQHCICDKPSNPDKRLIQCDNESCKKWLHEQCLINAILERLRKDEMPNPSSTKVSNGDSKKANGGKNGAAFKVTIEGRDDPEMKDQVLMYVCEGTKDGAEKVWEENVLCLFCQEKLSWSEGETKTDGKMDTEEPLAS